MSEVWRCGAGGMEVWCGRYGGVVREVWRCGEGGMEVW